MATDLLARLSLLSPWTKSIWGGVSHPGLLQKPSSTLTLLWLAQEVVEEPETLGHMKHWKSNTLQ